MKINFKYFEINFIASLFMIGMLVIRLIARYYQMTVLYDWATVTMYICMVIGGLSVVIGMCDGTLRGIKEWGERVSRRFKRA